MIQAVVPLPDHPFYAWQALVQYHAMSTMGWPVTFLVYHQGKPSAELRKLVRSGAEVEMWRDWRSDTSYNPAMKPGLVGMWLERYPEKAKEPMLLMDPDVIPTGVGTLPEASASRWFGTDTDSYTGPGYIKSKGEGLWQETCELVGVDPEKAAGYPGIGAQYSVRGSSADFWFAVMEKSERLYHLMQETARKYTPAHPVQAWCAEMYVMQLEMIRRGIEPVSSPEMEMMWADGPASDWERVAFFHDAGQLHPKAAHFHKGSFQTSPFRKRLKVSRESASYCYVQLIRETERRWPKLVW